MADILQYWSYELEAIKEKHKKMIQKLVRKKKQEKISATESVQKRINEFCFCSVKERVKRH